MKILTTGHKYELENFDEPEKPGQILQFIQKRGDPLEIVSDGTTNEEVLKMLINRLNFLNELLPSRETAVAITNLDQALLWLNKRTADRIQRGVEGSHKA
jgi:hypothetical protein